MAENAEMPSSAGPSTYGGSTAPPQGSSRFAGSPPPPSAQPSPSRGKPPVKAAVIIAIVVIAGLSFYIATLHSHRSSTPNTTKNASVATSTIALKGTTTASCNVSRVPSISMQGQCSNNLPIFVGALTNQSGVSASSSSGFSSNSATSSSWFYLKRRFNASSSGGAYGTYSIDLPAGKWYSLAITTNMQSNGSVVAGVYINGTRIYNGSPGILFALFTLLASEQYTSNFQYYNVSLQPSQIARLYGEGLGGLPVNLTHLVGWFPLDNNTYDHSGLGMNFSITNITFANNYPRP